MAVPYERIVSEDFNLGHGDVEVTMPGGGTATGSKVGIHTFLPYTFNVRDFGATGDGTTNDTTAVQAALDAAEAAGGGTVFVPIGTYLVKQLTVASKIRVQGQGWGSILQRLDGTTNYALKNEDETTGNTDIALEDLAFNGAMSTDPNTGYEKYGLIFGKVTRLTIARCFVYDWADGGLALRAGCEAVTVTDNHFKNNSINNLEGQANLAVISASNALIVGNLIEGPAERAGIGAEPNNAGESVDNLTVIGNVFKACGQAGFYVTSNAGSVGDVVFVGNTLYGCNHYSSPALGAIAFDPAGAGVPNFHCAENAVIGSNSHGVYLGAVSSASLLHVAIVQDNYIYNPGALTNNTYDGIHQSVDRNTVILNNVIVGFGANKHRYGINVAAVTSSTVRRMHGNVINGAQTSDVNQPASPNEWGAEIHYQKVKYAGPTSTGAASAILGSAAPALTSTSPYAWVDVVASDGSACVMPIWKKS